MQQQEHLAAESTGAGSRRRRRGADAYSDDSLAALSGVRPDSPTTSPDELMQRPLTLYFHSFDIFVLLLCLIYL